MNLPRSITAFALLGLAAYGASSAAAQSRYTLAELGTLGGSGTYALALNDSGMVVGAAADSSGMFQAFITGPHGAGLTPLGILGGSDAYPQGINASGQVAGLVNFRNGTTRAFVTEANGFGATDIGTLGGFSARPGASMIRARSSDSAICRATWCSMPFSPALTE